MFIRQPKGSNLCGQCCVAMVAEITIEESIELFGSKGRTTTRDLIDALLKKGIRTKNLVLYRIKKGQLPSDNSILKVLWKDGRSHWVVYRKGKVYDPAYGVFKLDKYKEKILLEGDKITSQLKIE